MIHTWVQAALILTLPYRVLDSLLSRDHLHVPQGWHCAVHWATGWKVVSPKCPAPLSAKFFPSSGTWQGCLNHQRMVWMTSQLIKLWITTPLGVVIGGLYVEVIKKIWPQWKVSEHAVTPSTDFEIKHAGNEAFLAVLTCVTSVRGTAALVLNTQHCLLHTVTPK